MRSTAPPGRRTLRRLPMIPPLRWRCFSCGSRGGIGRHAPGERLGEGDAIVQGGGTSQRTIHHERCRSPDARLRSSCGALGCTASCAPISSAVVDVVFFIFSSRLVRARSSTTPRTDHADVEPATRLFKRRRTSSRMPTLSRAWAPPSRFSDNTGSVKSVTVYSTEFLFVRWP
jgi:hypothetical protein